MKLPLLSVVLAAAIAGCCVSTSAAAQDARIRWKMGSTYPGGLIQLGTLGQRIGEQLDRISNSNIGITFYEPGDLVPALAVFDAVSTGTLDAAWSTPGYWAKQVPALQMFEGIPFGPRAGEYLAWYYFGGGQALFEDLYARHNIHSIICGLITPEASGWFKKEINTVDDFKGLKMRFSGLGAKVMEKLGVSTQLLAGGDIYRALERGTLDATEFSTPAIDYDLGFYQVAKHYYFPGWHQQSTLFDLMINQERWDALSATQKAQIETVCMANITYGQAESEALQANTLKKLKEKGIQIHRWSPAILAALKKAWDEVVQEQSQDADFARVWQSYNEFHQSYAPWQDLGYLD